MRHFITEHVFSWVLMFFCHHCVFYDNIKRYCVLYLYWSSLFTAAFIPLKVSFARFRLYLKDYACSNKPLAPLRFDFFVWTQKYIFYSCIWKANLSRSEIFLKISHVKLKSVAQHFNPSASQNLIIWYQFSWKQRFPGISFRLNKKKLIFIVHSIL